MLCACRAGVHRVAPGADSTRGSGLGAKDPSPRPLSSSGRGALALRPWSKLRRARLAVLGLAVALPACDSEAGATGGGEGEADAGADAAVDSGPPTCDPAPYQPADRCDLIGFSSLCEYPDVVPEGTAIDWHDDPPTSGDHYPDPASRGEHAEPVPRGTWVANLAAGGVVLLYACPEPCDRELADLRDVLAQRADRDVLLTPDPLLPGPRRFGAVAWTWALRMDPPVADDLLCFIDEHEGMAPPDLP